MTNKVINVYENPFESMKFSVDNGELVYESTNARSLRTGFEISINKWRAIILDPKVKGGGGVETCGLCHLYHSHFTGNYGFCCSDCPVRDKTGEAFCEGTPFIDWDFHKTTENAQAEFDFLVNLAIKNSYTVKFESTEEGE